jgi:hypothetical protein
VPSGRIDALTVFTEVSSSMGINGPDRGFPCWAWDYDNDGWLDIFATSYDHTFGDIVKGLLGQPTGKHYNKLFHNMGGKGFEDQTREAGLDMAFATMGSNYGDFDNDRFLDMYLGTGDPNLATLVPNRMFKNIRRPALRRHHLHLRHRPPPERARGGLRRLGPQRRYRHFHRNGWPGSW